MARCLAPVCLAISIVEVIEVIDRRQGPIRQGLAIGEGFPAHPGGDHRIEIGPIRLRGLAGGPFHRRLKARNDRLDPIILAQIDQLVERFQRGRVNRIAPIHQPGRDGFKSILVKPLKRTPVDAAHHGEMALVWNRKIVHMQRNWNLRNGPRLFVRL